MTESRMLLMSEALGIKRSRVLFFLSSIIVLNSKNDSGRRDTRKTTKKIVSFGNFNCFPLYDFLKTSGRARIRQSTAVSTRTTPSLVIEKNR